MSLMCGMVGSGSVISLFTPKHPTSTCQFLVEFFYLSES